MFIAKSLSYKISSDYCFKIACKNLITLTYSYKIYATLFILFYFAFYLCTL